MHASQPLNLWFNRAPYSFYANWHASVKPAILAQPGPDSAVGLTTGGAQLWLCCGMDVLGSGRALSPPPGMAMPGVQSYTWLG